MYLKVITMRIKDIADALHLSVSTVSKALNGGFDVSPETKEQVLKYAKENGYKSRDERLKVKSIRRLCVLFDNAVDSKSNIFIPLSLAFAEAARVNNFETITRPISDVTPSYEKFMVNNNYDGAFIVGLNYTSPFFKELETTKIPTVLYDNILNGEKVSTITNDNINTIQRLVTLLAKSGHKKIGFIHADKQSFVANERYAGYIIGLMMNNIEYNPEYVFYGSFSEASGFEASEFFAQRDVTAVVCSSDIIAVGFINGIERFHMTVPKDISVTGYDDLEISRYIKPPLTTIRQDLELIGERAYYLLTSLMMNRASQRIVVDGDIIVRSSVSVPRKDNE